ncbi:hypothetical protein MFLAVUS_006831 [Mucor flavus]|uniref:Uncharacterized protein n=1 Tax=Mucor flavus TaxID=439312 RepID=A0ABP9Z2M8_9FUNG
MKVLETSPKALFFSCWETISFGIIHNLVGLRSEETIETSFSPTSTASAALPTASAAPASTTSSAQIGSSLSNDNETETTRSSASFINSTKLQLPLSRKKESLYYIWFHLLSTLIVSIDCKRCFTPTASSAIPRQFLSILDLVYRTRLIMEN